MQPLQFHYKATPSAARASGTSNKRNRRSEKGNPSGTSGTTMVRSETTNVSNYLEQFLSEIHDLITPISANDFDLQDLKDLVSRSGLRTEHF
jgi:hypothetical protein